MIVQRRDLQDREHDGNLPSMGSIGVLVISYRFLLPQISRGFLRWRFESVELVIIGLYYFRYFQNCGLGSYKDFFFDAT